MTILCIDQNASLCAWIPVSANSTSGPQRKLQAQIVLKRRSLVFPSRFLSHRVRSLRANFPSGICPHPAPALAREAAAPSSAPVCSTSRHIILCKWAMQMSYANASGAISRQFVIFLSRRLFIWDYLFLLLLLSQAACSAVMARPVRKERKKKTERSWAACFIRDCEATCSADWRTFPALEKCWKCVCGVYFSHRVMGSGCCFHKVREVTSGHSFHFIFLFPEFGL